MKRNRFSSIILLIVFIFPIMAVMAMDFVVVDTEQDNCYNNTSLISCPEAGDPFFGQDAPIGRMATVLRAMS